ncbi:sortase-associated OmpA-like protein PdsO [Paraglaciecola marina]|uniref:sortase-associated OmpA-like protein PdsO n=1 Tax=Paraglaciecola marina TaxID=2500157 RepID=UPI00106187DF|nr:sortase-associated OmpA-like protein PdsO [Paraglaciecola marina]
MKFTKITTAFTFTTCLLSASTFAQAATKEEKTNEIIAVSSGAIIGTVLAGPVGGFVAAVFGGMIAEDVNSDKRLFLAEQSLADKDQQLLTLQQNFQQAKERATIQIAAMDQALEQSISEIESNIQFKTGSYALEEHYQSQLDLIANTLIKNPKLSISLSGFADQRGDSTLNQALSEQRTITVKNYLENKGVKNKQVITNSYGESLLVNTESNYEGDFFDRRVMLKISNEHPEMATAATHSDH